MQDVENQVKQNESDVYERRQLGDWQTLSPSQVSHSLGALVYAEYIPLVHQNQEQHSGEHNLDHFEVSLV